MSELFTIKPDQETLLINYYIELNKGIVKTLEYVIDELPFYKYKRKKFLKRCINELNEYINTLKPINTEE